MIMAKCNSSGLVEVLYHFESNTTRGHIVNVQPGEQYYLVNDDDDDWCYVTKTPTASDGFYLPRTFVKQVTSTATGSSSNNRFSSSSMWRQNAYVPVPVVGRRNQRSGQDWLLPASGRVPTALVHFRPLTSVNGRLSNSIPVNLNLLPLIPEDAAAARLRLANNASCSAAVQEPLLPPAVIATDEPLAKQLPEYSPTSSLPEYSNAFQRAANQFQDVQTDGTSPIYANVQCYVNSLPVIDSFEEPIRYLDDGWEERVDRSGRHFFYHPLTHKCTWKPPRSSTFIEYPSVTENAQRDSEDKLSLNKSISGTSTDSGVVGLSLVNQPGAETYFGLPDTSAEQNADSAFDLQLIGSSFIDSSLTECNGPVEVESTPVAGDVSLLRIQSYNQKGPQKADKMQFSEMLLNSAGFSAESQKVFKTGTLTYCRLSDKGKRLKKHWLTHYVFLTQAHLIFYKDKKSSEVGYERRVSACLALPQFWLRAQKKENQYEPPLNVCELDKSRLRWIEDEKGRRKRVFQLSLLDGTSYLFCSESEVDIIKWYTALSDAIANNLVDEVIKWEEIPLRTPLFRAPQLRLLRVVTFGIPVAEPVFGSSLTEICKREGRTIPKFVILCTQIIEQRDLNTDGLYRMSGNLSQIQKIRCQVDQEKYSILEFESDVHVLTGALKLFFRELQEPLFPHNLVKSFMDAIKLQVMRDRLKTFVEAIAKLPAVHHDTLDHLLRHLLKVAEHSSKNRMQIHNLAIVFGPTLFSTNPKDDKNDSRKKSSKKPAHGRPAASKAGSTVRTDVIQSNSHLAFNMIMHGQIVEYMLREHKHLFKR
ncbi:unnamed protein product [Soboliphyme baturini]|uniref:Rho GTPase-activating protein 27 n=1 Tax=Soboliphyme baturini TaxID=241478 RepID=A0A183IUW4_9BILA|nr:unnamed protein product [Soboliphyme baturini]